MNEDRGGQMGDYEVGTRVALTANSFNTTFIGEIVLVPTEIARHKLIPHKLAYYLPRLMGKPVLPEGWVPRIRDEDIQWEQILPAFPVAGYDDATALLTNDNDTSASSSAAVASRSSAIRSDLDKERRDKIKSLQHIIFDRQPLDETSTTSIVRIHGSVSNEDIAKHIRHSLGIHLERDEVEILKGENDLGVSEDKKIKTLGAFKAKVLIEDFEWVVDVEVKTPTTT